MSKRANGTRSSRGQYKSRQQRLGQQIAMLMNDLEVDDPEAFDLLREYHEYIIEQSVKNREKRRLLFEQMCDPCRSRLVDGQLGNVTP